MQITFLFNLLIFLLPITFLPVTSEIFEFNKMILVYVFTILICFFWAKEMVIKKRILFKNTLLTLPIFIFLASQLISTIFSIDSRTSLLGYYGRFHGGLLSYICYALLYFSFVTFIEQKSVKKFITTFLISVSIVALWATLEHFGRSPSCLLITGNFDALCFVQDLQSRVFATFGQPNWLAAYLSSLAPLAWSYAILKRKSKKLNITYFTLGCLLFATLLFTKSRSGLLGVIFAFIIFWLPNVKKHFFVFALTTIFCLLTAVYIWNPFMPSTEPPVEGVTESGDIRKIVWEGAIELWKKYPVFGTGVETFAYSYYETRPVNHNLTSEWNFLYNKAHNEYLNFAATTGTIGLASYLLLIITSLRVFLKSKLSLIKTALLAGYVNILISNFFGFSTVTIALLFFLFPAIAIKLNEK